MILNKFIWFISQIYKTLCYKCQRVFKIAHLMRTMELVIFPGPTINFVHFRKHLAQISTLLTADTSKLTKKKRNTGRRTTLRSGKGMNG